MTSMQVPATAQVLPGRSPSGRAPTFRSLAARAELGELTAAELLVPDGIVAAAAAEHRATAERWCGAPAWSLGVWTARTPLPKTALTATLSPHA